MDELPGTPAICPGTPEENPGIINLANPGLAETSHDKMDKTTDTVTDETLFKGWQKGSMEAFDHLYRRYRQSLLLFLMRRGHQKAEAEEIFHECWMRIIRHQDNFQGSQFKAWLFTIAKNLSTDQMRAAKGSASNETVSGVLQETSFSTDRVQEAIECVELIKHSVASLPLEQRDVFLLQNEAGLSLDQIAILMDVGRETVKSRIRYAMKKLRDLMAECL